VYAGTVGADGTVGLYRVEVSVAAGSGKLRTAGRVSGATKESINRAFRYMLAKKSDLAIAREFDVSDLHVEVIDLLNNHLEGEIGLAFFVAAISALNRAPSMAALLLTGDLSVQGNIKGLRSLVEPLQVAMDNAARRALIPLENKRNFLEVTGEIMEHVDPIFFGDPKTAAFKALGLT
jgi:ATP-dependent Lon protease